MFRIGDPVRLKAGIDYPTLRGDPAVMKNIGYVLSMDVDHERVLFRVNWPEPGYSSWCVFAFELELALEPTQYIVMNENYIRMDGSQISRTRTVPVVEGCGGRCCRAVFASHAEAQDMAEAYQAQYPHEHFLVFGLIGKTQP